MEEEEGLKRKRLHDLQHTRAKGVDFEGFFLGKMVGV